MTEIWIYDDIGPDWMGLVSSKGVISELAKAKGKPVTVRINSPGGDVVEGQAIYNALRRHSGEGGKVRIEIDALAASMASYIAMAGDEIHMAENSMLMIHSPWTVAIGNAQDLRATADILEKLDGIFAQTYSAKTGLEVAEIDDMLKAETWLTAAEAVEKGFADKIGQELNVAAKVKQGRFGKTPPKFLVEELPREHARSERIKLAKKLRMEIAARA